LAIGDCRWLLVSLVACWCCFCWRRCGARD